MALISGDSSMADEYQHLHRRQPQAGRQLPAAGTIAPEIRQPARPGDRRDRHRQDGDAADPGRRLLATPACRCSAADIKGDLSGIADDGRGQGFSDRARRRRSKLDPYEFQQFPVIFWDLFGEQGHPIRTTVSEMGPLLLSRLMNLDRGAGRRASTSPSRSPTRRGCCCST